MSNFLTKLKLLAQTIAGVSKKATSGVVKSSPEVITQRLSICEQCPKFSKEDSIHKGVNLGRKCTVCGCHMKFKAALEAAKCPEGKW